MQAAMTHAKGMGIVFAIDRNARSKSWHDVMTNKRGKAMEESLISKHFHIPNEESRNIKFQTCRRASNIDLTVLNNTAINFLQDWAIYDRESCSDHNIIQYDMGNESFQAAETNNMGLRYTVTQKNMVKFQERVIQTMEQIARETGMVVRGKDTLDETLCQRVTTVSNIEAALNELQAALDYACRSSFRQTGRTGKVLRHKSVPWRTSRLTTYRKEVNAKIRRYQRTKENNGLREQRKEQYLASKAEYTAAIRQEKSKSWKEFCNVTSAINRWNAIYKMAAGKTKHAAHITTLKQ
jgi:hypothetical protein